MCVDISNDDVDRIIDQESVSFSALIKVGVIEKLKIFLHYSWKLVFYSYGQELRKCNTTVLKNCTNIHASLVSDNVGDHEPSAKR